MNIKPIRGQRLQLIHYYATSVCSPIGREGKLLLMDHPDAPTHSIKILSIPSSAAEKTKQKKSKAIQKLMDWSEVVSLMDGEA